MSESPTAQLNRPLPPGVTRISSLWQCSNADIPGVKLTACSASDFTSRTSNGCVYVSQLENRLLTRAHNMAKRTQGLT
jgi:hypothetical protein